MQGLLWRIGTESDAIWCTHIGSNSGHIEQTHLEFLKCLWMFDTEQNEIGILDNLF